MTKTASAKSEGDANYTKAGATLLAQQPSDPATTKPSQSQIKNWKQLQNHLEQRLNGLRTWRTSWWFQNFSELSQYLQPRRSIWMTQSTGGIPSANNMSRGKPLNTSIVDPTGTYAVRVCSSGMMGGLASPSRPWFKITPSIKGTELDGPARAWIDEVEDRVYTVLAQSNFYNSFAQECEDLVVYGTAPVIIYEDERDVIRCYNPAMGEYYLASGATMRVDTLNRQFVFTTAQMVDFFGVENCPPDVQKAWAEKGNQLDVERIVCHSIEPNFGIGGTDIGVVPGNFAWREVYWVWASGSAYPLSMRGFVDQPFMVPRWATQSNDAYGRSVGMDVLPDVIQLQVETVRKAEAIEKMVRPPLLADMQLKNQPSSSLPGHVTYVANLSAGSGMRSIYEVNPEIKEMMEDLAAIQARIKTGFFNDVILQLSTNPGDRRTAYEVAQLVNERLQVLGPVIENIINESLKPRMKRVYGIMKRKGMLPPLPDSLKGVPLGIEFMSMLAVAQKAAATGGVERILALVGNMAAVYPDAKDMLNPDKVVAEMNQLLDNPQNIMNGPEEIQQMRAARQKAQQAATTMQALQHGAQTASIGADAANTLSQTQIGGGQQALAAILGTGGPH